MPSDPFAKWRASTTPKDEDPFAKWRSGESITPSKHREEESHPIAALAKGAVSGALGAIPDIASSLYNLPASAVNYASKIDPELLAGSDLAPLSPHQKELPLIPSATEGIEKGIDTLTGGYTDTPKNIKHLYEGTKLAGAVAGPGGIGAITSKVAPKVIGKTLGALGSTKPSAISGGATAGAAMSKLEEEGVSPLGTIAGGLGAAALTSLAPNPIVLLRKTSQGVLGLSPKRLNLKAAKAAKESGIELPSSAFTDSKLMALADQFVGKTPYFGNKLRDKYLKAEEQTINKLNELYEKVGSKKSEKVDKQISSLYDNVEKSLLPESSIYPEHTANTIHEIQSKIKTATLSPAEKDLLSRLEEMKEKLVPYKGTPTPVEFLVGTKKSLNSIIHWNEDQGVKNLLRRVQNSILQDIADYGKKDPTWYKAFKDADELFGKVAKRERLEHLLSERATDQASGNISYNNLSKIIHTPKTRDELKRLTSPEVFEKIEKLGEVARTMAIKSQNIPNPSGTSIVTGIGALLTGLYTAPVSTVGAIMGLRTTTKLLTDQKFLDLAIKAAENPKNISLRQKLRKNVKDLTGLSIESINRKLENPDEAHKKKDLVVDTSPSDKYR